MNSFSKENILYRILSFAGFWFPFLIIIFTFYNSQNGLKTIGTYFCFSIILIIINYFVKNKKVYFYMLFANMLIYSICSFVDISHFDIFQYRITGSTIYVLIETNLNESKEFVKMYLRPKLIVTGILLLSSFFFSLLFSFRNYKQIKRPNQISFPKKILMVIVCLFCTLILIKDRNHLMAYTFPKSIVKFIVERNKLTKIKLTAKGDFKDVVTKQNNEKETYVIVIGESTTRTHMGLYGYYRDTNKLLKERINELLVFDNVQAPHVHTIASLGETLTIGNYDDPSKKYNNTLVQLFNNANFKTYLLSNQRPIGMYDTTMTLLTKASSKRIYTNSSRLTHVKDEVLLEPLKEILNENVNKKFIIIHLMGTHVNYSNRFPSDYAIFKKQPITKFNHKKAYQQINDYDNAVLYNDYVVNSIINYVESSNSKSFVLYFSDHGDDVYETTNMCGHSEKNGTPPMYEIPFVLWRSESYKKSKKINFIKHRKYNNRDLIHTIADLSDVNFHRFDKTKSIINPDFIETP